MELKTKYIIWLSDFTVAMVANNFLRQFLFDKIQGWKLKIGKTFLKHIFHSWWIAIDQNKFLYLWHSLCLPERINSSPFHFLYTLNWDKLNSIVRFQHSVILTLLLHHLSINCAILWRTYFLFSHSEVKSIKDQR